MPAVAGLLSTTLAGLELSSPLMNASGAFNASLFNRLYPLQKVMGAIVTKTVTQNPQAGNIHPRTVELPGIGMLNSIGLQNPGLVYALEKEIPELKACGLPVILSISAHSSVEFAQMAEFALNHPNGNLIEALELNLSCPNVEKGGVHFGSAADSVKSALQAVTAICKKPVFAKLTPNVGDIVPIAGAAIEGGASGLTTINTVLGVAIDIHQRKPVMPRISAGYSGPGIKPIALHAIWNLRKHFPEIPIIGVGGISNTQDVLEFLMAGATVVQIGTICFRQPMIFKTIAEELAHFCKRENVQRLCDLSGCAHA